jgi:hypothetical protein
MKRTPLVLVAGCITAVSPLTPALAKRQCQAEAFPGAHWSYRIIDDRKCWYEGKPMLSRSLLEWPAQKPAASAPAKPPIEAQASPPGEGDGFEARWRDRFLNAMGKF